MNNKVVYPVLSQAFRERQIAIGGCYVQGKVKEIEQVLKKMIDRGTKMRIGRERDAARRDEIFAGQGVTRARSIVLQKGANMRNFRWRWRRR